MKEKIDSKLIRNYTRGTYSFRDLKKIANWFEDLGAQDQIKSVLESHWSEFELDKTETKKDLSAVYSKLRSQILLEKTRKNTVHRFFQVYSRVAAILLIPVLIYSLVTLFLNENQPVTNTWVEIVSPKGTRTHFDLPDGSKVSLNSGTHLKYNATFWKKRQVQVEGEAYFEVVHNAASPFVVETGVLDVTVLGTKFSVASMSNENMVEVILQEGKVQLDGQASEFHEVLLPNQGFYYDKSAKKGTIASVDAPYLTAWKDGLLIFRNEPLGEVLKRIGRWYNVSFDIKDKEVEHFRYRATFQEEPLSEVLRLISLTAPIEYEIQERNMDLNGIYNEKIVTIKLKN